LSKTDSVSCRTAVNRGEEGGGRGRAYSEGRKKMVFIEVSAIYGKQECRKQKLEKRRRKKKARGGEGGGQEEGKICKNLGGKGPLLRRF